MGYAKLDDGFWRNAKVETLSDRAFRLYVRAISFSSQFNTDGVITQRDLRLLEAKPRIVQELVETGAWDACGSDAWQVHDYTVHNVPAAERSARGKRGAAGRWGTSDADGNASGNATRMQPASDPHPTRISPADAYTDTHTKPDTKPTTTQGVVHLVDHSFAVVCQALENAGIELTFSVSEQVQQRLDEGTQISWLLDAIALAKAKGKTNWPYVAGVLNNWGKTGKTNGYQQAPSGPVMRGVIDDPNYVGPDRETIQKLIDAGEL